MIVVPELEPGAIRAAHDRIDRVFRDSPQYVHDGLSERLGRPVIVKVETVNPIRAFKGRGTWLVVRALAAAGAISTDRPVVCASAGNFGQGVAYAARSVGIPAVVFASTRANAGKVAAMRRLGADVRQHGDDFDAARGASEAFAAEHGGHLLVDGDDPRIAAGAATLALEVSDAVERGELPAPGTAYVPVGNGALIDGVGAWLKSALPSCRVVGIQAEGAPAMTLSWRAGRPIDTETADTAADGIAARIAIPAAVAQMPGRVDDMRLVPETALVAAQGELTEALGITVELAAAASWAGALAEPEPATAGPALLVITGSNA